MVAGPRKCLKQKKLWLRRPYEFTITLDTVSKRARTFCNVSLLAKLRDQRSICAWWAQSEQNSADEAWNSQTHPNCGEYDLFEIGRSHLGNPGVVVGSEARFLLQDMNLALHLRHLVI